MDSKYPQRNASYLEQNYNTWEIQYSQKIEEFALNHLQIAIQKLQPPNTAKGCRSFAEMVNFLSMFCPELQKLLIPIYDLRKGREYI